MSLRVGDVFEIDYFRDDLYIEPTEIGTRPICESGDVCRIDQINHTTKTVFSNSKDNKVLPSYKNIPVYTIYNITKDQTFEYVGDLPIKKKLPLGKVLYE